MWPPAPGAHTSFEGACRSGPSFFWYVEGPRRYCERHRVYGQSSRPSSRLEDGVLHRVRKNVAARAGRRHECRRRTLKRALLFSVCGRTVEISLAASSLRTISETFLIARGRCAAQGAEKCGRPRRASTRV